LVVRAINSGRQAASAMDNWLKENHWEFKCAARLMPASRLLN